MTDKKSENQTEKTETKENKGMTRREMLKLSAVAGTGIAVGATGLGTILNVVDQVDKALTRKKRRRQAYRFMRRIKRELLLRSKPIVISPALIFKQNRGKFCKICL